jgi:hypothetical protein
MPLSSKARVTGRPRWISREIAVMPHKGSSTCLMLVVVSSLIGGGLH